MSSSSTSSSSLFPHPIITTAEAETYIGKATFLDASWYLPAAGRNGHQEFLARHIPTAQFFDINGKGVSDTSTSLPHMLPTPEEFAPAAASLGITKKKPVIVYDGVGLFSAARVWWTLTAFGHPEVSVLSGGFPKWLAEKRPVEETSSSSSSSSAVTVEQETWQLNTSVVRALKEVILTAEARKAKEESSSSLRDLELYVDARPGPRFEGAAPEPRAGLGSGHIPKSRSLPFGAVLDSANYNQLLPREQLCQVFTNAGIDLERKGTIVTTCGSGVTAAVIYLAMTSAGRRADGLALYDGAFAEYGMNELKNEIAVGAAENKSASDL